MPYLEDNRVIIITSKTSFLYLFPKSEDFFRIFLSIKKKGKNRNIRPMFEVKICYIMAKYIIWEGFALFFHFVPSFNLNTYNT